MRHIARNYRDRCIMIDGGVPNLAKSFLVASGLYFQPKNAMFSIVRLHFVQNRLKAVYVSFYYVPTGLAVPDKFILIGNIVEEKIDDSKMGSGKPRRFALRFSTRLTHGVSLI